MRVGLIALACLSIVTIAGCASTGRAMSYGNRFADARYEAGGKTFSVWIHPTEPTIMLQSTWGSAAASGAVEGATLGVANVDSSYATWMAGARALTEPAGCEVQHLRPLDQSIMWEFDYVCPEGVDLRALIMSQRAALRQGARLAMPPRP